VRTPQGDRNRRRDAITSEDAGVAGDTRQGTGASAPQPGFARIIDVSDPTHPEEVARYEVPDAGVQDLWIDGERLYVAAQSGGGRVVDISADLMGNLYYQGREIARLSAADVDTGMPNVVAVQPPAGWYLRRIARTDSGCSECRLRTRPDLLEGLVADRIQAPVLVVEVPPLRVIYAEALRFHGPAE
jgi:hypothetical protein